MESRALRIGFLVNPLAGLGGRVGLKGSDGADIVAAALARGARPLAQERAVAALRSLANRPAVVLTAAGAMGERACRQAGIDAHILYRPAVEATFAADTMAAVRAFLREDAGLVLFAGGDGTARDVFSVVGQGVPMLGIPAGVKMYSGVFALSPAHAGLLAARFRPGAPVVEREILDIDEDSLRRGRPATRLYGYGIVPRDPSVQAAKASPAADDEGDLVALCRAAARALEPGWLHVIGPGSTMHRLLAEAGHEGALLGVDLLADGELVGRDVEEAQILSAMASRSTRIHVGVIGGTGCLFGRGNQPISAEVLRRVPRGAIAILASPAKLALLGPGGFFVDTGDPDVDRMLAGYVRVDTAPGRSMMMKVRGGEDA